MTAKRREKRITDTDRLNFVFGFLSMRDSWNNLMDHLNAYDDARTMRQILDAGIRAARRQRGQQK